MTALRWKWYLSLDPTKQNSLFYRKMHKHHNQVIFLAAVCMQAHTLLLRSITITSFIFTQIAYLNISFHFIMYIQNATMFIPLYRHTRYTVLPLAKNTQKAFSVFMQNQHASFKKIGSCIQHVCFIEHKKYEKLFHKVAVKQHIVSRYQKSMHSKHFQHRQYGLCRSPHRITRTAAGGWGPVISPGCVAGWFTARPLLLKIETLSSS